MGKEGYGAGFSCCVEADIGETVFTTFWNGATNTGKEEFGEGCIHHFGARFLFCVGARFSFCVEADIRQTVSITLRNGVPSMDKEECGEGFSFCVEADVGKTVSIAS